MFFPGSPAEHSRLAPASYTPLGFPTTVPVPLRRSIEPHPSIIVTRIPSSDIITLPHVTTSRSHPNNNLRRHLEPSNEKDASENSYTFAGEDRSGNNGASEDEDDIPAEIEEPESLLRVDEYADDFKNYNLRSHVGAPAANPDVRYSKPETGNDLGSEATVTDHSVRKGEESHHKADAPKNAEVDTAKQMSRTGLDTPRPNTGFHPMSHYANPFTKPGGFVPGFTNYFPHMDSVPKAKHNLPEVEASLRTDSLWPRNLVNKLIQATTLATKTPYQQPNQFDLFYPYSLYYPTTNRYF